MITPADHAKVAGLDRNAKEASFALKQERYRQRLNRYSDRMRNRKPGSSIHNRPEQPITPSA